MIVKVAVRTTAVDGDETAALLVAPEGLAGVGPVGVDLLFDRLIVQSRIGRPVRRVERLQILTTLSACVELFIEVFEAAIGRPFSKRRVRLLRRPWSAGPVALSEFP